MLNKKIFGYTKNQRKKVYTDNITEKKNNKKAAKKGQTFLEFAHANNAEFLKSYHFKNLTEGYKIFLERK